MSLPVILAIGIDPSLTRTAVAFATSDGLEGHSLPTKGKAGATLQQRADRIQHITDWVNDLIRDRGELRPPPIYIEGPSHGNATGHHHDRSGLWWAIVSALHRETPAGMVTEVPPTTLKVYATGKGNAGKDEVLLALARRHDWFPATNNDEADACVLALIGARLAGHPIDGDLPKSHLRALDKLTGATA